MDQARHESQYAYGVSAVNGVLWVTFDRRASIREPSAFMSNFLGRYSATGGMSGRCLRPNLVEDPRIGRCDERLLWKCRRRSANPRTRSGSKHSRIAGRESVGHDHAPERAPVSSAHFFRPAPRRMSSAVTVPASFLSARTSPSASTTKTAGVSPSTARSAAYWYSRRLSGPGERPS